MMQFEQDFFCVRKKAAPGASLSILNPPCSILFGCGSAALRLCG
jgi:hypothetical protein